MFLGNNDISRARSRATHIHADWVLDPKLLRSWDSIAYVASKSHGHRGRTPVNFYFQRALQHLWVVARLCSCNELCFPSNRAFQHLDGIWTAIPYILLLLRLTPDKVQHDLQRLSLRNIPSPRQRNRGTLKNKTGNKCAQRNDAPPFVLGAWIMQVGRRAGRPGQARSCMRFLPPFRFSPITSHRSPVTAIFTWSSVSTSRPAW